MKVATLLVVVFFCFCFLPAQEFPPTFEPGPFPTGLEPIRNDAPCDVNVGNDAGIYHEYTVYQGTPVVDGNVDDDAVWNQIPWTVMTSYDPGGSTCYIFDDACEDVADYEGWEDITAWFKVLWDDDYVYFATKKIDNEFVFNEAHYSSQGDIWQDDAYQIVLNTNDPNDNDESGVFTEIGITLLDGVDAAYNNWLGIPLELADGDGVSEVENCDGKAVIGSQVESDNYYTEVIEMAFIKWDEIVADEPQMFSIMANDPDEDHAVQALQWGHGIFNPKNWEFYASILYSTSEPPSASAVEILNQPGFPTDYSLNQNYPNPFNPTTQISYTIAQQEYVQLHVYSLTGEKIATLVNQNQAPGTYQVNFNAENLPSGIYFYQLETKSTTLTRKMTLLQ
jgi:hypothetical protein